MNTQLNPLKTIQTYFNTPGYAPVTTLELFALRKADPQVFLDLAKLAEEALLAGPQPL